MEAVFLKELVLEIQFQVEERGMRLRWVGHSSWVCVEWARSGFVVSKCANVSSWLVFDTSLVWFLKEVAPHNTTHNNSNKAASIGSQTSSGLLVVFESCSVSQKQQNIIRLASGLLVVFESCSISQKQKISSGCKYDIIRVACGIWKLLHLSKTKISSGLLSAAQIC